MRGSMGSRGCRSTIGAIRALGVSLARRYRRRGGMHGVGGGAARSWSAASIRLARSSSGATEVGFIMRERRRIVEMWRRGGAVALVTLVGVEGSSYRRVGARLLVGSGWGVCGVDLRGVPGGRGGAEGGVDGARRGGGGEVLDPVRRHGGDPVWAGLRGNGGPAGGAGGDGGVWDADGGAGGVAGGGGEPGGDVAAGEGAGVAAGGWGRGSRGWVGREDRGLRSGWWCLARGTMRSRWCRWRRCWGGLWWWWMGGRSGRGRSGSRRRGGWWWRRGLGRWRDWGSGRGMRWW